MSAHLAWLVTVSQRCKLVPAGLLRTAGSHQKISIAEKHVSTPVWIEEIKLQKMSECSVAFPFEFLATKTPADLHGPGLWTH
jgi:hypothetical protein